MQIIDLTMELADGTQTHPAHPRCVVIEFARHAFTAPRFQPPCQGFASRLLKALGCDLATPDDPRDMTRPVHLALLGRGIPIMEHVVNLEDIPVPRFQFVGVPLRIKDATGSPIRAFAMLEEKEQP